MFNAFLVLCLKVGYEKIVMSFRGELQAKVHGLGVEPKRERDANHCAPV